MAMTGDPSLTTGIVNSFRRDIRSRLVFLRREIWSLFVRDKVLGATFDYVPFVGYSSMTGLHTQNALEGAWRFKTSDEKLEAFKKWLQELIDQKLLTTDHVGDPWDAKYVESAYKKGVIRAFVDARKSKLRKTPEQEAGMREQFLKDALAPAERVSKLKLLALRTFEQLKGVSALMAVQMNRILADGLLQGLSPRQIARTMVREIQGIEKKRALMIARTEIIHAHAEGQLDGFQDLGIDQIGIYAEWSTAGDEKVCPDCGRLEGTLWTVEEARGQIPRHPNCRCAWIPAVEVDRKRRIQKILINYIEKKGK